METSSEIKQESVVEPAAQEIVNKVEEGTDEPTPMNTSTETKPEVSQVGEVAQESPPAQMDAKDRPELEMEIENPPDPSSCPSAQPLTIQDKINMDTSLAQHSTENESLDVHVDDTQNDLDADIQSVKSSKSNTTENKADIKEEAKSTDASEIKQNTEMKVEVSADTESKTEGASADSAEKVETVKTEDIKIENDNAPTTVDKSFTSTEQSATTEPTKDDTTGKTDKQGPTSDTGNNPAETKRSVWFVSTLFVKIIYIMLFVSVLLKGYFFIMIIPLMQNW